MIASSHKCDPLKSDFGAFQANQKFAFWHLYCQKSQEIKPINKDDVCLLKHFPHSCPPEWRDGWMNEYVERCRQMQLNVVQDVLSSVWSAGLVTPPGSDPHTPAAEILPARDPHLLFRATESFLQSSAKTSVYNSRLSLWWLLGQKSS